ncbi:NADH-quinone oxidoreductase subunit C [Streptomyces sp. NPDC017638]|uniref:NADH-quinone oxidoreductase subunit C n=1 Tax=Streptomyces sp. NPDC017638 TaxID=3365004 RepID=UPI0037B0E849
MSTPAGWLPAPAEELFGADATAQEAYDLLTVDVPPSAWLTALETARTTLACTYFDWLSAVDEPGTGFRVAAHVVALHPVRRLLVRTTVPRETPVLPSAVGVYAGAGWHERETHEMFGVVFEGHPGLEHLLLPETFEGHPLRKDFVLAARVAKAWPGAKEPGESEHGGPKRRQMLPPGVPDPNEWGPLKGQLPPAPTRPARTATARPAGDRPVRRTRSSSEGSATQTPQPDAAAPARPRRMRSASEGSASQAAQPEAAAPDASADAPARPRRMRSASEGSASQAAQPGADAGADAGAGPASRDAVRAEDAATRKQAAAEDDATDAAARGPAEGPAAEASVAYEPGATPAAPRRARSASEGSASQRARAPRSSDAPWHHARPAFEEPEPTPEPQPRKATEPEHTDEPKPERAPQPQSEPQPQPQADSASRPAASPPPSNPDNSDKPDTPDPAGGPQ